MPDTLNTKTVLELALIKEAVEKMKNAQKYRACRFCGEDVKMKSNQIFCTARCKTAYHNEANRILFDQLMHERGVWEKEREDFIREISTLQKELSAIREINLTNK